LVFNELLVALIKASNIPERLLIFARVDGTLYSNRMLSSQLIILFD